MVSEAPGASEAIVVSAPGFFFNDTATSEIYALSLHDALPIYLTSSLGSVIAVVSPSLSVSRIEALLLTVSAGLWVISSVVQESLVQAPLVAVSGLLMLVWLSMSLCVTS